MNDADNLSVFTADSAGPIESSPVLVSGASAVNGFGHIRVDIYTGRVPVYGQDGTLTIVLDEGTGALVAQALERVVLRLDHLRILHKSHKLSAAAYHSGYTGPKVSELMQLPRHSARHTANEAGPRARVDDESKLELHAPFLPGGRIELTRTQAKHLGQMLTLATSTDDES